MLRRWWRIMKLLLDANQVTWWQVIPKGALVTTSVEKYLADSGRLEGAVTIGNPLHKYPWAMERAALAEGKRVDYCLDGDFVCDFSLEAASNALSTKAELHASYFLDEPTAQDIQVIDAVAELLSGAK